MPVLLLLFSVIGSAAVSVFGGYYNRRHDKSGDSALYNLLQIVTALLLWSVFFLLEPAFDTSVLIYSLLFGICYAVSMIGIINALRNGSVALTSLILQFSILAATVWGFFFWDTPITVTAVCGLVLVAISLCLCFAKKKGEKAEKITAKWLLFAAMAFIGNAGCTVVQKEQQMAFNGQYGGQLMMGAMAVATLFCLVLFLRGKKTAVLATCKRSFYLPMLAGGCNMLLNLCVILLATSSMSPAVIYPVISVGGLAVTMLFSLFAFREKLSTLQWTGIAIGAVAVAVLSL